MLRPGSSTYFAPGMRSATYLPHSGGINGSSVWWTTRVGTRTVGSSARTSISASERHHASDGRWACRQAFIRAHAARISSFHGMSGLITCCDLPGPPHGDRGSDDFLGSSPSVRSTADLRSPPARPARLCGTDVSPRTAPLSRTRRRLARRTASRLPRSSSTAVMLSAHCSKVGSAPGVTGSDAPVPGWSKKISRPSDVIASTHP